MDIPPGPPPDSPPPKKLDGRRFNGGPRPGAGIRKGTKLPTKRTYNPAELADSVADSILTGSPIKTKAGPPTLEDSKMLKRVTSETVEVFNERVASKLRLIADLAADRITEKLQADEFKSSELGFILSVAHDKRLSLDGSRAVSQASINVQVNNYGTTNRKHLHKSARRLLC